MPTSPQKPIPRLLLAVAAFYAAALLLRAPALLRAADNLPLDSTRRTICLAAMRPLAAFSHNLRLDALCAAAESFERKNLE
jgi:hypothetical protein